MYCFDWSEGLKLSRLKEDAPCDVDADVEDARVVQLPPSFFPFAMFIFVVDWFDIGIQLDIFRLKTTDSDR